MISIARRRLTLAVLSGAVVLSVGAALVPAAAASAARAVISRPASAQRTRAARQPSQDWPAYLFSATHPSSTSGPATITLSNAGDLTPGWQFQQQPPAVKGQPTGGFSASPTVADGMIFIGSQTGDFYALQESTGQVVWQRTLDYEKTGDNGHCGKTRGIVGTATVAPAPGTGTPTVYAVGARYLYALDAATGAQEWKALVGPPGSAGLTGTYYNYASPTVANGYVYMGISASCSDPFVRGGVQSFSQRTGHLLHTFWTDPPGKVGASVWSSVAAGADTVWATTGDSAASGTQLYHAYSFVRLGAQGLQLRSAWQLKLGQNSDLDFGSTPNFFTGTVNGKQTALVGACNKNGRYYAMSQYDLARGPVWSVQVGASAHTDQGMCLSSAVWNEPAGQLYLSGNTTTIGGTQYDGSVQAVDASTGQQLWATGLPCAVLGTPALDSATGVLAVATWAECGSGDSPAVYLINASTGAILGTLPLPEGGEFAQPVFAGPYLLIANWAGQVVAYTPAATKAAAGRARCTGWCGARPAVVPPLIPAP